MEDALNRHSLTVFGISAYLFAARLRYLRCNGACSPNVRVIADENSGILDLLSDPSLQSLRQYSPSYFSAFDFHGFLASSVPVVVRHIHKLLFSRVKYHRELITTQDGGTIALDHAYLGSLEETPLDAPVVLMHHGICGDSQSEYLIHSVELMLTRGFRVVVLVARGCGGLRLTTQASFNASRLDDMELAIESTRARFPAALAVFALSYSLGAGILLNHLGKSADCRLDGAVCVSPPWNLMVATAVFPLFSPILALSLKLYAFSHLELLVTNWRDLLRLLLSVTMYQLESFFLHMHGYESVEEYYVESSAAYSSHNITVPTLAISAEDDPVCCHTASNLEYLGPGLAVVKTQAGGHLGFAESSLSPLGWVDKVSCEWFSLLVHEKQRQISEEEGLSPGNSVVGTCRALQTSYVYNSEKLLAWDEATGQVRQMKLLAKQSVQTTASTLSLMVAGKAGLLQIPTFEQLFQVQERPHTPLDRSMSSWSMGVLTLPPMSFEGPESFLDSVYIFYVCDADIQGVELNLADPSMEGKWIEDSLERVKLTIGDSFYIPPGNIFRIKNISKTSICRIIVTSVKECS